MKKKLLDLYISMQKIRGKKLVHFIHVGKTAGTAIKAAVTEQSQLSGNLLVTKGLLFYMHGHNFKLTHVGDHEMTFFLVRDPIQRFVSGFYSRLRMGQPKNNNPWSEGERIAFQYFKTPNDLGLAINGTEEAQKRARFALENIGHVRSSYWDWFQSENYFKENRQKILFVLRQEHLQEDFEIFREKLAPKLGNLPKDEVRSHRSPEGLDKRLSKTAVMNLKDWFSKEYDFLDLLYWEGLIPAKYPR